jgi:predicted RNA-binding Zn-ribbon protein involved in translation (DUF1610 family)
MIMKKPEESVSSYNIDLIAIEGDGSFPCPKCGLTISPEDDTEENYKAIDTTVVNNELAELVIECGKCRTAIKLTGFQ